MKTLRRITLLFILALFCHSADHRAVLRAHQANDGLWHDGSKTDLSGTLFALMVLEASSAPEDVAATQRTRAAIYLNCQEDGSLLGTLPFALASQSDDIFMLSSFHNEEGWIQEPGGFPDWATTLLMLLLAPSNGRTEQDCAFLLKDTPPDNIRASLLLLFAYLRHHLQPPSALLHLLDKDVELFGFFEQALALFSLARLSRWDEALKLRTHLLASQLPEGGWGEAEGFPFDVVTTSLAILALDCFHVNENTLSPDLSLKESTTSLEDDNAYTRLTTVVSNMGSVASGTFQLSISALMPSEVLPLACATVPYLAPWQITKPLTSAHNPP